ncbi:hypothetical protein HK099_004824, partial [Clydaea vesicula]
VYLESEVRDRLDKLLGYLESQDGVCGNGTMLILGDSCLFSRFSMHETRMILHYNKVRPLGINVLSYTPVFCSGAWQNLYFIRLQNYVLVVMAYMGVNYSRLERKISDFRMSFIQSRLEIPTEAPLILLRLFAKRETLAMLYHNIKTGNTIFPQLRPSPEIQQREILQTFWNFFSDASASLRVPGVTEFSVSKDLYKFYARSEGVHKLYLLLANDSVSMENVAMDVLKNLKNFE